LRPRDVALALLVVVLWGVNFVVIKVALRGVSPFVLGGLRFVVAAIPAVLFVKLPRVPLRLYLGFALTTFIGQFALLFWAIKVGMPSGLSSVVHQSQAFITVLVAAAVFGEKPGRAQLAGMVVAALGLFWIGAESGTSFPLAALALNLCASTAWAAGNLVPVIGLLAGTLALGERLSAAQLAGSALVATGLALPVAAAYWQRHS
jgi:O-acetylserine/cysteine efflux transporter